MKAKSSLWVRYETTDSSEGEAEQNKKLKNKNTPKEIVKINAVVQQYLEKPEPLVKVTQAEISKQVDKEKKRHKKHKNKHDKKKKKHNKNKYGDYSSSADERDIIKPDLKKKIEPK